MERNKIKIILDSGLEIKLELYPDIAPISVANFLKLVDEKYYDGVCFHRVIDGFMIQAGGYFVKGNQIDTTKKIPPIKGEFNSNGIRNDLHHIPGVISMARTSDKNSASSQFFICSAKCPHLDGEYAAFGKTIDEKDLENVLKIASSTKINVGGGLTDFPYPVISIKTIERL